MSFRVLITGGAGFIGRRLVNALLEHDQSLSIWVYDNLHQQVHGELPEAPAFPIQVKFLKGDVGNYVQLLSALEDAKPDIIYHLAAETGTGQSYDEPTRYSQVNVIGTTNLVQAIRQTQGVKKVILAASRAVYGEGAYQDANGQEYVGLPRTIEQMSKGDFDVLLPAHAKLPIAPAPSHALLPVAPASIYASTKLMQEYILTQAGEGASWDASILRFQNVYGPGQSLNNPYTGVLSIFSKHLISGQNLSIFEDGEIARDFVFVDDVVNALIKSAYCDVEHGTIIDIGYGEAVTILDCAKILMRALGVSDDSYKITGEFRAGDIRHACADIDRAQSLLKWEPKTSVELGLGLLAKWVLDSTNVKS